MIEIYSITDNNKSKSPYAYLHSYCCPKCACTDESKIICDDSLVLIETTFGKNRFLKNCYTMLPHKCLNCGECYVMVNVVESHNTDFIKALITTSIISLIHIAIIIIGIINYIHNENTAWIVAAICFTLFTMLSAYGLSEEIGRYRKKVLPSVLIEEVLHDSSFWDSLLNKDTDEDVVDRAKKLFS